MGVGRGLDSSELLPLLLPTTGCTRYAPFGRQSRHVYTNDTPFPPFSLWLKLSTTTDQHLLPQRLTLAHVYHKRDMR